ncbi:hypothetical protein CC86DRAFT_372404 [Ophiobolus disseminans]|uniref:Uncharacterized protein n=1 Tax=Ophiobolus disseminans TaxID=1469910 RepID=A0A6A6ZSN8_9PLEO|nr:hypothetical protein CC86DRAFT_372404 [Ophiobolus disseminans]
MLKRLPPPLLRPKRHLHPCSTWASRRTMATWFSSMRRQSSLHLYYVIIFSVAG